MLRDHPVWPPGPKHRCIVVIDIAGFGRWDNRAQLRARAALGAMVRNAFRAARIPCWRLAVEDRGDGMIVLVPATVSKVDILDPFIPRLAAALREHNSWIAQEFRIRLRVSMHAGEVHRDVSGWVGSDLNLACRLVNSERLYQHLRRSPHVNLVLVVSEVIYGVVRHGYRNIVPDTYELVPVVVKEVNTQAWVHAPDEAVRVAGDAVTRLPRYAPVIGLAERWPAV